MFRRARVTYRPISGLSNIDYLKYSEHGVPSRNVRHGQTGGQDQTQEGDVLPQV